MNCPMKASPSARDSSSEPLLQSPLGKTRQMHEKLSENALDLDPIARTPFPFSPPLLHFQIYANIRL
jgi:hypothetical protein